MLEAKGNATTPHQVRGRLWQDNHSGRRGHKLMTRELGDTIPAIGATGNADDYDAVLAPAKLFSPYGNWTWYVTEWDAETGLCFGLVEGFDTELGYFDLTELAEQPCSAASPPWSATSTGSRRPSARSGDSRARRRRQKRNEGEEIPCLTKSERKRHPRMP